MNLKEEKTFWKKGYKFVAGLDEAGRGALAGPVVAAAVVIFNCKLQIAKLKKEANDSKKLSPKKRGELYEIVINHPQIEWGIGSADHRIIDRINILNATKLAMKYAVKDLNYKLKKQNRKVEFLILDGNFKINSALPQKTIIKGDGKVLSCALASILAKVTRDRIMEDYEKKYPHYGFSKHKGYPTLFHRKILKKLHPCKIHRKTFSPVRESKILKSLEKKTLL